MKPRFENGPESYDPRLVEILGRAKNASPKIQERIRRNTENSWKGLGNRLTSILHDIKEDFFWLVKNPEDQIGAGAYQGWTSEEIVEYYFVLYGTYNLPDSKKVKGQMITELLQKESKKSNEGSKFGDRISGGEVEIEEKADSEAHKPFFLQSYNKFLESFSPQEAEYYIAEKVSHNEMSQSQDIFRTLSLIMHWFAEKKISLKESKKSILEELAKFEFPEEEKGGLSELQFKIVKKIIFLPFDKIAEILSAIKTQVDDVYESESLTNREQNDAAKAIALEKILNVL